MRGLFSFGGGMTSSLSVEKMRAMISLSSGLPGTMPVRPDLPPFSAGSRESIR